MKRILKIKTADFIEWYFNGGSDQENESTALAWAKGVIDGLKGGAITVTAQDLFDSCTHEAVPIRLVELEGSIWINQPEYGELDDLHFEWELKLT